MAALRRPRPRQQIADRLRRLRIASGITQEEAARRLRISRSQWCNIESGSQSIPAERILDFAQLVGATSNELLGVREDEKVAA